MTGFTRISLSIDEDLLRDIDFQFLKETGKQTPKNSYGKIVYGLLRPIIPDRKAHVTPEGSIGNGDSNKSTTKNHY